MNNSAILDTLDNTVSSVNEFISTDKVGVISHSEKSQLKKMGIKLENLHRKLKTNELEVAVVGLEKAGKSKFSSAFVNEEGLFPSADERCTFTSTKLQYDTENYALVEFYSKEEFNQRFEAMLVEIKFPGGTFESIQMETFTKHFGSLKKNDEATYLRHSSKTELDIKDVIEGREKISSLLGLSNKKYTNFNDDELKGFITDKYISRAVKNVTFFSSKLKGLENIILHDVPGFDSPTQVHLEQTIKKLQDVDAIIMVKNIKMPSLKGPEVDVLVRNGDMDGIKLYEKLFVFGSYADATGSLDALNKNKDTLTRNLSDSLKTAFNTERLFTGCLDKAYESKLKEFGGATELEQLKQSLERYNKHERSVVLEKRIIRTSEEIKCLFKNILNRSHSEFENIDQVKLRLVLDYMDNSREILDDRLSKYINQQNKDINESRFFTVNLEEKIESIMPVFDQVYIDDVADEIRSSDTRSIDNFEELNIKLRDKITKQVKGNLISLVLDISRQKAGEIEAGSIEIVLNSLDIDHDHEKYSEIRTSLENFIGEQTKDRRFDAEGFKSIVERFTVDLIETVIGCRLGSDVRQERFHAGRRELYMLSLFSKQGMTHPAYKSELVSLCLTQQNNTINTEADRRTAVKSILESMTTHGATEDGVTLDRAKLIYDRAISKSIPISSVLKFMSNISIPHAVGSVVCDIMLDRVVDYINDKSGTRSDEDLYIEQLTSKIEGAKSKEIVREEIELDLTNLRHIFTDCAIEAIALELPFKSAITYYVDTIKSAVKSAAFRSFISENIKRIEHRKFADLDDKYSQSQITKKVLSDMAAIVKKIESGFNFQ
jgi:hypothetical protein